MLNSKLLLDRKIITGPIGDDNIAQVGIDLNVIEIQQIHGGGIIPFEGKTTVCEREPMKRLAGKDVGLENAVWMLGPGVYDVTFEQGCNIPADVALLIRQRSSLLRNGTILHSSVFDPGFRTKNMGTVIVVLVPIVIEYKARIAQIYGYTCEEVAAEALYDGQFQEDKQRDESAAN